MMTEISAQRASFVPCSFWERQRPCAGDTPLGFSNCYHVVSKYMVIPNPSIKNLFPWPLGRSSSSQPPAAHGQTSTALLVTRPTSRAPLLSPGLGSRLQWTSFPRFFNTWGLGHQHYLCCFMEDQHLAGSESVSPADLIWGGLTDRFLWMESQFVHRPCVAWQLVQNPPGCGVPHIDKPTRQSL